MAAAEAARVVMRCEEAKETGILGKFKINYYMMYVSCLDNYEYEYKFCSFRDCLSLILGSKIHAHSGFGVFFYPRYCFLLKNYERNQTITESKKSELSEFPRSWITAM